VTDNEKAVYLSAFGSAIAGQVMLAASETLREAPGAVSVDTAISAYGLPAVADGDEAHAVAVRAVNMFRSQHPRGFS